MSEKAKNIICLLLAVLSISLFVAIGGDDERDLAEHAQWMQELEDGGEWVIW